jgi:ERCC4-type nuclease
LIKFSQFISFPNQFDISQFDLGTATGLISAIQNDKDGRGKDFLPALFLRVGMAYYDLNLSVDIREQEKMMKVCEKYFKVAFLNSGDLTSNIVGFERKGSDLFPSVFSERIFQQLHELKQNYEYSYLVVDRNYEDVIIDATLSEISAKNVIATIASFVLNGFPPLFLGSQMAVADLTAEIMVKAGDGKVRDGYQNYQPVRRKATKGERAFIVVSSLPGVSDTIAKRLLEKFGTVERVFGASKKELEEIEGIGKVKASSIFDVIHEEVKEEIP